MDNLETKVMKLIYHGQVSVQYHNNMWLITCAYQFQGMGKTLSDAVNNCLEDIKRSTQ